MYRWTHRRPTATLLRNETRLWALTVAFFVLGDVATTSVGVTLPGVVELGPVLAQFTVPYLYVVMVALKAAVAVSCYLVWRAMPEPYCAGIPLGLAAVGVAATGWNLVVIATAVAG